MFILNNIYIYIYIDIFFLNDLHKHFSKVFFHQCYGGIWVDEGVGVFHWYLTPDTVGVVKDTAFIWPARLSLWNSSVFPWSLIFLPAEMPNHWTKMFFRMRDHLVIDSLLLKELGSCCAKESNFLPREAGLKLMESASGEVTHWPNFTSLCQCVRNVYRFAFLFSLFYISYNMMHL